MSNDSHGHQPRQSQFNSGHRRYLIRMRSDSGYFRVYHDYIRYLGLKIGEAAVLSDMINVAEMTHAEDRDGWFDYTVSRMQSRTGIAIRSQNRMITVLVNAGCIEVTKAGNPARRRVRINIEDIENTVSRGLNSHQ